MDPIDRLKLLSTYMDLEPDQADGCPRIESTPVNAIVSHAVLPGGRRIPLVKTLLTSACERNCYYCPFRAGRDFRRATFQPMELARMFMNLHNAGIAQGIFLSSGIFKGGIWTQDELIETAEILRYKLGYCGYMHLKIMPGAERAQVERSMQLASRVSVNLEAPNDTRLQRLAPRKEYLKELIQPLQWVQEIRHNTSPHSGWNSRWPSSTTQFVVGGANETDRELLSTTDYCYKNLGLRRVYFSSFRPIPDTPLEEAQPASPQRELRLYQASFLIRDYGYTMRELQFEQNGFLPLNKDPKLLWADHHLKYQPVEINNADYAQLIRIPGIGPKGANSILKARRDANITNIEGLSKIGVNTLRVAPYILLNGRRPLHQKTFWG